MTSGLSSNSDQINRENHIRIMLYFNFVRVLLSKLAHAYLHQNAGQVLISKSMQKISCFLIMVLSVTALALLMLIRARSYQYLVRTGKSTSMQMKVH